MSGTLPVPLGVPNATNGAPTTPTDQVIAAAKNLPDLINKATAFDPPLAAQWTGKALIASKTFYGSILVLIVTEIARRYALNWDPNTVDLVAGIVDIAALGALRMITELPITGIFRKATPAEAVAKVSQAAQAGVGTTTPSTTMGTTR